MVDGAEGLCAGIVPEGVVEERESWLVGSAAQRPEASAEGGQSCPINGLGGLLFVGIVARLRPGFLHKP